MRPDVKLETIEVGDGCELGVGPDDVEEFGSCVSDKGWVDDEELAPACSC